MLNTFLFYSDKALADHMWDQYKTRDDSLITGN